MLQIQAKPTLNSSRAIARVRPFLASLLVATLLAAGHAHAQESLDWTLELVPGNGVRVYAADTDFTGDVWVAGRYSLQDNPFTSRNFIARWDGEQWVETPAPQPAAAGDDMDHNLRGFAALGPDDAIAVGVHDSLSANVDVPQSMRWNGSSWDVLDAPAEVVNSGNGSGSFSDVSRTGDTAWAVGTFSGPGPGDPAATVIQFYGARLVDDQWEMHFVPLYDGVQNQQMARYRANAVAGASADDVWLGGEVEQIGEGPQGAVLVHWNGSEWNWADIWPLLQSNISEILDIVAIASDDVWAVGHETVVEGTTTRRVAALLHWNGTQWSRIAAPDEPDRNITLRTVSARSSSDIYAAGVASIDGAPEAYLLHYDGQDWSTVPDVQVADGSQFFASAISLAGELWLAGRANEFSLEGLAQRATMSDLSVFVSGFED